MAATITPFIEKSIEIRDQDIEIRNLGEGMDCTLYVANGQTIKVRGAENILNNLTVQDLKLYVDLIGTGPGSWDRQVRIDYGSDIEMVSGTVVRAQITARPDTSDNEGNTE